MRLLICAGGTGGGVYPALAVLQAAENSERKSISSNSTVRSVDDKDINSSFQVLWIGSEGGMEIGLIKKESIPYKTIPAAGVHGVGLKHLPGNLLKLLRGYFKSRKILDSFQPDVLLFTGGFVAVPMALAAIKYPSLLFVPDIEPGLALKSIARFADHIAISIPDSKKFYSRSDNISVTGYPVRKDLKKWSKQQALQILGLKPDIPILFVFGGSKGARSINRTLDPIIETLLQTMQVIHITGELDWHEFEHKQKDMIENNVDPSLVERYKIFPYLYEQMGAALSAADLVVSRSGASILGEFPAFGLPAILVPYPHAWQYQYVNAEYLESQGAAIIVRDGELSEKLLSTISEVMRDPYKRKEMSQAMRKLDKPEAAENIYRLIKGLLFQSAKKGREL
jgi:undecaprenyldiphospho-muramoylpentapeptide beta-N-acetylglucosaminyltransferase